MDNRPIGVFDTGIGGLTAVKELRKILPHEDIVYFGDTARVPYGTHGIETIRLYSRQDAEFLASKEAKLIFSACGTVSSTSMDAMKEAVQVPVIGVIDAGAEKAAKIGGNILVMGTGATVKSHAFKTRIMEMNPDCTVYEKACPLLSILIEQGYGDPENPVTRMVTADYISEFQDKEIGCIVLGCTHYSILVPAIQAVLPGTQIVDAGKEAAYEVAELLKKNRLETEKKGEAAFECYVSGVTDAFVTIGSRLLELPLEESICRHRIG